MFARRSLLGKDWNFFMKVNTKYLIESEFTKIGPGTGMERAKKKKTGHIYQTISYVTRMRSRTYLVLVCLPRLLCYSTYRYLCPVFCFIFFFFFFCWGRISGRAEFKLCFTIHFIHIHNALIHP